MKFYDFVVGIAPIRKKYAFKFFLVTIPLAALALGEVVFVILMDNSVVKVQLPVFVTVSLALAVTAIISSYILFNKLISPLRLANRSLENYIATRKILDLPVNYEDEAGQILANVQQTLTKLDTLIVEKSDMVDLLSHDLRSPVGRILSLSNMIKSEGGGEVELYSDYIINECTGLLSLLENILLILREENNEFRLEFVNLNKLIQETLSFYQFSAAEKNLKINVSIDEGIYIPIQQQLFKQAIRNILGNAIKFSPEGKSITIVGKQDDNQISLSIKDEGLGFKPSDMKKIFERFTTANKKGTHGEASTGLGLYLSKKIVEKHGGKLVAESDGEYKGASFTIVLYRLVIKKPQDKVARKREMTTVMAFRGRD
ncbi:MAG: hypothetical protein K0Q79_2524 [Flavipsychrobacter sp.]|jgi:signal transduction histidine kinase|nr:hypothetical protein [Flavipsychrobacter sp.]